MVRRVIKITVNFKVCFFILFSIAEHPPYKLFKVYMIIYMVNAKAMVSIAAGAVPELKVRVLSICPAANSAFMAVRLVGEIAFDLFGSFLKVDYLR